MVKIFRGGLKGLESGKHYCYTAYRVYFKILGLAKMFVWVFRKMLWKNPNELFGQPNTTAQ